MASTVLTRKGQVTIPVEFRRALKLAEGDRLTVTLDRDSVRLARTGSVVERTAGILRSGNPSPSAKVLRENAEHLIASEALDRSSA